MRGTPPDAIAALVLAHGAGAGMSHANMQAIADALEHQAIVTPSRSSGVQPLQRRTL